MLMPKILAVFVIVLVVATFFSITYSFDDEEEIEFDPSFENDNDEENMTPEIEAENNKLFKDFVFKHFEKIDERIGKMEAYLGQYYLKTDKSDDFGEIYYELNYQRHITKRMIEILKDPRSKEFKTMIAADDTIFEKIIEVFQQLKTRTIKIEELLENLKHWESFEKVFSLLDQQQHDIQLLKDVIENPSKLPKQSHLLLKKRESMEENGTNEYYNGISQMSQADNAIFGFVVGEEEDYLNLTIFGAQTQQPLGIIAAHKDKFVKEFLQIFKHPKFSSIILQIDGLSNHVEYVIRVREKLNSLELPYIFVSSGTYMHTSIMVAAGADVKVDESIVIVLVDDDNYIVTEFKYTPRGYLEGAPRDCHNIKEMDHEEIEKRIIGPNNPAKIILHSNAPNKASMKLLKHKILKKYPKKLIILEEDWRSYDTKFALEMEKYLSDNSYTNYFILPVSFRKYMIGFECGGKRYPLIVCKKDEILPFKKTVMISKTPLKHFLAHTDDYDKNLVIDQYFQLSPETQGHQFTLEVDANNFLKFDNRSFFSGKIPALAKFLDKKDDFKIPVIAFHFELSFIYVYDDEANGYKLLDSWNGKLGKDLFISFDEKTPNFFEKATRKYQSKCISVVHDIIQTMAKPLPKTFGYSIITNTDDSENTVLFEYTNFDGTKKTATPALIMSKLLKEHLKAIEKEIGEFPNEISLTILDEFNDKESINRIKKELKKSCDLVNLKCSFVDTNFVSLV